MKKRGGLGKGLAALIPTAEGDQTLELIPVDKVRPNPYQPRQHFDEDALQELAESIQTIGVLQPVLVRKSGDMFELIAGERRWRAARRAGLRSIPAVVRDSTDTDALAEALTENLQRVDLSPLEEASAYQQLIEDFNLTHDEIALKVGKSRPAVSNALRLLQLPPVAQRLLAEGKLSAGHARALLSIPDRAAQERLAVEVAEKGLSVRQAEERARSVVKILEGAAEGGKKTKGAKSAERATVEPDAASAEELIADALNAEVVVRVTTKGSGYIKVKFASNEDLQRIVAILCGAAP